jgi:MFS family permease
MSLTEDKKHIIIFAFITAICLFGDSMLYIVLPVHYAEAGLSSLWEVGVILSVNRIVRLPLNPCIGFFYRHISERTGICIAVFLATLTTCSYGFLDGFFWWILARCAWGLAWTLLRLGSLFCILKLSTHANRGQMTGLYNGLYRLGSLVGMLLGGILADTVGLRMTAVIFGSAGAAAVLLALLHIPKGRPDEADYKAGSSLREAFALMTRERKIFWLIVTGCLMALAIQGVIASTLSRLIEVHTGGEIFLWGAAIGAASLAGFFQALRWGWEPWLAPRVGRISDEKYGWQRMFVFTLSAGTVFFTAVALPLPLPLWFCCILGLQLTATAFTTVSEAAASDLASSFGGRALLMHYALIVDIGSSLGPLLAYGMNAFFGINAAYLLCAAFFVPLALVWRK